MASRKKLQDVRSVESSVSESHLKPEIKTTITSNNPIPPGFRLVPEDYVSLPPNVYQDLLNRTQQTVIHKGSDEHSHHAGPKTYLRVVQRVYLGDCRLTLQEGQQIEYYPRRSFIANGKEYRNLHSIKILIDNQKNGGDVFFEQIDDPSSLEIDEWGDFREKAVPQIPTYEERVTSEERHQATKQMSRKERIAAMGKNSPPTLTAPQPTAAVDALPPRGSKERKELIRRRGMKNIDQLGTNHERISDIKVQATSQDTRVVGVVKGQSAMDTSVKPNTLLGN